MRGWLNWACDAVMAVAAVAVIVAPHWPWFQATLTRPDLDGMLMEPSGTATGLYGHGSLWVATGIAVVQLVLLLARHYPGGRPRLPGDGVLIGLGSVIVCLIVARDMLTLPGPWITILSDGGGVWPVPVPWWRSTPGLVMTLGFGAVVAAAAAVASLVAAFASPGPPVTWPVTPAGHQG
jgi:hypothetical protein